MTPETLCQVAELLGNHTAAAILEDLAKKMSKRDYEGGLQRVGELVVIVSSLTLIKSASQMPSPEEVVALAKGTIDNEVKLFLSLSLNEQVKCSFPPHPKS